jgi:hypothetical protein
MTVMPLVEVVTLTVVVRDTDGVVAVTSTVTVDSENRRAIGGGGLLES